MPVEESTAGKNGGIGSAVGIYSTNILNPNITFGDIAIKAIGGNTYSQEITSGKYTHEGKAGVDGASDKNLNGGAGANGGNGGLAIATGVDITGSNNTATGGVLTVTATGSDGGHGGYGGVGGTAAAITTVPAKAGDGAQGADGADSTTSGTTPSTAGANGTIGGAGGDGLAGADGTAGTVGAVGLTGGIGGNGSNGGSGSNAEATGLKIAGSGTATTISLGGLVVEAAAGNGGAGGAGGAGGIGGVGGTGGIGGNGGDAIFLLDAFSGAFTDQQIVMAAHVGNDGFVPLVTTDAHGAGIDHAAERDDADFGRAAADIDNHRATRFGNIQTGPERRR